VSEFILSIINVAERKEFGPELIIHAADATCSWMWSDPSLPSMSCSVVGSVSVLLTRWPGGGESWLMSKERFNGRCVHTLLPICWCAMGWLSSGMSVTVPVEW
jgi:hypothetical protein